MWAQYSASNHAKTKALPGNSDANIAPKVRLSNNNNYNNNKPLPDLGKNDNHNNPYYGWQQKVAATMQLAKVHATQSWLQYLS